MDSLKLWARNGEAVRQAIELGEIAHIETASEELIDEFLLWLLLDSGVVDVIMSYNAICTSRIILEGLVFQEPYKRGEPSKRPCEHKTLESNKSPGSNRRRWRTCLTRSVRCKPSAAPRREPKRCPPEGTVRGRHPAPTMCSRVYPDLRQEKRPHGEKCPAGQCPPPPLPERHLWRPHAR